MTHRIRALLSTALVLSLALVVAGPQARVSAAAPAPQLRIVGPAGEDPPVVNERKKLKLRVVDETGADVTVTAWSAGSPTVAKVTKKGLLKGRLYGFVTITAQTGRGEAATTAVVARVTRRHGSMGDGDTKSDSAGRIYLTSPDEQVVYRSDGVRDEIFAGTKGQAGYLDGIGQNARFHYPTGLGVDVSTNGGLYVADTDNHCIRKVGFDGRTSVATGVPQFSGRIDADVVPADEAVFNSPKGVAALGQSLFVADTRNHALYFLNGKRDAVSLLAGQPGVPGFGNGLFREATFNLPSGLAINTEGNLLAVADTGNDAVRLVRIEPGGSPYLGRVSTAGVVSKAGRGTPESGFVFSAPTSVAFDSAQNVCVVDSQGASVITRAADGTEARVLLAQPGSLGRPASIVVSGTRAIIADADASSSGVAIAVVEVGAPKITAVTPPQLEQDVVDTEVVINGENFPPEALVVVDGIIQERVRVESATRIVVMFGGKVLRGSRLLTVLTRGGAAQREIDFVAPALDEISAGEITTFAGTESPQLGDGGLATDRNAVVGNASDVSLDSAGNVFITSQLIHRVRRIDAQNGTITTIVGTGRKQPGTDGLPGVAFALDTPGSCAIAPDGAVFVSDTGSHRIVRVDPITTRVFTVLGTASMPGQGLEGENAGPDFLLSSPMALAIDQFGNLFVADVGNGRLLRVDSATNRVSVVAGGGPGEGVPLDGEQATLSRFRVDSLDIDEGGDIFLAVRTNGIELPRIVHVGMDGRIRTVAAEGGIVACAGGGELFISRETSAGSIVERIDSTGGNRRAVAGGGAPGAIGDGEPATNAILSVTDVAVDGAGNVLIADRRLQRIRRVDSESGLIATVAGKQSLDRAGDGGFRTSASINGLTDLAWVDGKYLYMVDKAVRGIRVVNVETGLVSTPIGGSLDLQLPDPSDGDPATGAQLRPFALASGGRSRVLFSSFSSTTGLSVVWSVGPTGKLTFFAGGGSDPGEGVPVRRARLGVITDLAWAPNGDVYFVDYQSRRVRVIEQASMTIRTIAGHIYEGNEYSGEGGPAVEATFVAPEAIAISPNGDLFIADDARILKVSSTGFISTVAGAAERGSAYDGQRIDETRYGRVAALALDDAGNLFVVDAFNNIVLELDFANNVAIYVAGVLGVDQDGDDGVAAIDCPLHTPDSLVFDGEGNLYVGSDVAGAVRVIKGAARTRSGASRRH